jgi:hypothetical protein
LPQASKLIAAPLRAAQTIAIMGGTFFACAVIGAIAGAAKGAADEYGWKDRLFGGFLGGLAGAFLGILVAMVAGIITGQFSAEE